jgi:hypothetical protein
LLLAGRYTLLEQEPIHEYLPLCLAKGISVNLAALHAPIPAAFWAALREQGLVDTAAPISIASVIQDSTAKSER